MNRLLGLTMLSVLFGGGVFWGISLGWSAGPIGLIGAALVFAYLLFGDRRSSGL
jgi:hypothetical protein